MNPASRLREIKDEMLALLCEAQSLVHANNSGFIYYNACEDCFDPIEDGLVANSYHEYPDGNKYTLNGIIKYYERLKNCADCDVKLGEQHLSYCNLKGEHK